MAEDTSLHKDLRDLTGQVAALTAKLEHWLPITHEQMTTLGQVGNRTTALEGRVSRLEEDDKSERASQQSAGAHRIATVSVWVAAGAVIIGPIVSVLIERWLGK